MGVRRLYGQLSEAIAQMRISRTLNAQPMYP
jgi:hypothetical protein